MRVGLLLLLCGCLQTGGPSYGFVRDPDAGDPPFVQSTMPDILTLLPDGGNTGVTVGAEQTITATFSQTMDPDSLRPGIAVFVYPAMQEVPIEIQTMGGPNPLNDPTTNPTFDIPYTVSILPASGTSYAQSTHLLVFRTLLVNPEGIPMAMEQEGFFQVP
jgi:hypothetical protein